LRFSRCSGSSRARRRRHRAALGEHARRYRAAVRLARARPPRAARGGRAFDRRACTAADLPGRLRRLALRGARRTTGLRTLERDPDAGPSVARALALRARARAGRLLGDLRVELRQGRPHSRGGGERA
jgi:hypothetical protein